MRALLPAVKYQALAAGEVDVIDGYSTDGLIARYDLVVLVDDRRFFPPYEAAALVSGTLAERRPERGRGPDGAERAAGRGDHARLNQRVEVDGEPVERVAAGALADLGLTAPVGEPTTAVEGHRQGLVRYLLRSSARPAAHDAAAPAAGGALARGRGGRRAARPRPRARPRGAEAVRAVGVLQTIPGIALLAFMIPLLGIGVVPALVALFLYSLYPILRNTYTGVRDAAPARSRPPPRSA